ncbi:MAG: protein dehydratase [Alphaproteobacteria bacterium HGW-Alphaproteobacteria-2]|nr:MAG: protein dehydratase [Alphaproteobacteria bacterium HGW-Alphaproteobacteria-2]
MGKAAGPESLDAWIGREERAGERLSAETVRRFRATLDLPEGPLVEGTEAPPLVHLCLAPPALPPAALGPDGHPARGGFLPPAPGRRMWAGGAFRLRRALRIGEKVTRLSMIADIARKEGRSGPLVFVTVNHAIAGEDGLAVEERQDIVYRAGAGTAHTAQPAPEGRWRAQADASAVTLFRYSALTFNGHRIHYDHPYATGVEGYPGLVVHGPLQATWLCHFAARLRGGPPARFAFRSLSPVFADAPLWLNADEGAGGGLKLWTAAGGGPVAMQAEADWEAG